MASGALERLRASTKPRVLFVSHGERGGVARHVEGLARALEPELEILLLQPQRPAHLRLRWARGAEDLALHFARDDWQRLVGVLAALRIDRVLFHHVHGLPREVLDLPASLGCAHDLTLHDYYPACPNYHLTDASGRYCASEPGCQRCLDGQPAQWAGSIDDWRRAFAPLLAGAARVIAPSEDTARRIARFFPGLESLVVWPHPEEESPAAPIVRVLVPGAISRAKGLDLLEACVADALRRGLPLHFRVLGFVARALPVWPHAPLSVHGEYPDGRLGELIALEHGDAILFAAQCPETFSYTLSAALDSGVPIVATALGAFPERLATSPFARLVPWDASPGEINDALVAAGTREARAWPRARMSLAQYRERYLDGVEAGAAYPAALPALEPTWLEEPRAPATPPSLAHLFEDGVVCGRAESRERLRAYAFDPDSLYAALDARVRELIEALDAERRESQARLAEQRASLERLRGSRSWRLTAPLRGLARWLRGAG